MNRPLQPSKGADLNLDDKPYGHCIPAPRTQGPSVPSPKMSRAQTRLSRLSTATLFDLASFLSSPRQGLEWTPGLVVPTRPSYLQKWDNLKWKPDGDDIWYLANCL